MLQGCSNQDLKNVASEVIIQAWSCRDGTVHQIYQLHKFRCSEMDFSEEESNKPNLMCLLGVTMWLCLIR